MIASHNISKGAALLSFGIMAIQFFITTPLIGLVVIIIGTIWITAFRLNKSWVYDLLTGLYLLLIATGALFEMPPIWVFTSLALILYAYDLNAAVIRTSGIEENETLKIVETRHLVRTTVTILIGVGIAVAAFNSEIEATFGQLFFLGSLLFISLNFTIGAIQNLYKTSNI